MRFRWLLALALFGLLVLSACNAAAPAPEATQDLSALRTEVAATVLAECSKVCALTPTATMAPTNTPQPSATSNLSPTPSQTPVTVTPVSTTGDRARWVSQSVQDGTRFAPGETFTMTWRLQNAGTSTWTTDYRLRFYSGDPFGATKEIILDREVKPNETVDITIQMKAPAVAGDYRSDWVMSTESRRNFNEPVFLKITVGKENPTATITVTPTTAVQPTEAPTLTLTVTPTP